MKTWILAFALMALPGAVACGDDDGGGPPDVPPVCTPAAPPAAGFHVATTGTPEGDGTAARPWDLQTALGPPAEVQPGDTIWVHGGVYRGLFVSRLEGTEAEPVTLRSYPGEWAVLDAAGQADTGFQIYRGDAVYRDLELRNSAPDPGADRPSAIWIEGARVKLVHLVIHDTGNVPVYEECPDLELYGCLIYHSGRPADDLGHNLYLQNRDGLKRIEENVIFDGFAFGVHAYGEEGSSLRGLHLTGNVLFGNSYAGDGRELDNLLMGGIAEAADDVVLRENFTWRPAPDRRNVRLGYDVANGSVALIDNYLVGQLWLGAPWSSVTATGNTVYGEVTGELDPAAYPDNDWRDAPETETRVFVRPSRHEMGRAHVIVYNWADTDTVDVDLSPALAVGERFEVRLAQAFLAGPLLTGTWSGTPLAFPMTGHMASQPVSAPGSITEDELPGRRFAVFVVRRSDCP